MMDLSKSNDAETKFLDNDREHSEEKNGLTIETDNLTLDKEAEELTRDHWSRSVDFIIACVGYAVGLGNVWRFPYLCYKNGGGAFLIPYAICLITCGIPLFLLEMAFGQYMGVGSIQAWMRLVPAFTGLGIASFVISVLNNIYYIIVLAWAAYYLFISLKSLTSTLPWASCDNEWNTDMCFSSTSKLSNLSSVNNTSTHKTVDSVVEYWEKEVLHISDGVDQPGRIVPQLAISLLVVWIVVWFCVCRGVRWTGKIVYFTALFPYAILTVLLIRGLTLDGAAEGIRFYLEPDFTRLADPEVWIDGATQIFYSYGIAVGAIITLGSYNKFNNHIYRDCLIISGINSFTSLYGGFAVFSVLGYMAQEQNVTVAEVAESGPGLVFLTYPKAVTQMPLAPIWAVLFFFMIFLVGLDTQFVGAEGILTPIYDIYPKTLQRTSAKMIITAVYCALSFLVGLCMVTEGGMYVFQVFDYYSASGFVLLWVCFFECFAIAWIFGANNFVDAIELMIGTRMSWWYVLCWKFLTPVLSVGICLFMLVKFTPLTYNTTYIYPGWAQGIGFCLAGLSMVCVPLGFVIALVRTKGNWNQNIKISSYFLISTSFGLNGIEMAPTYNTSFESSSDTRCMDGKPSTMEPHMN